MLKVFAGKPFGGVVTKYDPKRNLYSIKYEDGDEEEMDEGELALVIVGEGEGEDGEDGLLSAATAGAAPLGPLDIAALLKAAPSRAARAHVLRAAAAATGCFAAYASPALAALKAKLLAEVAALAAAPAPGSEAEQELAAVLAALTAWGSAGDLAHAVAAALNATTANDHNENNDNATNAAPASKKAKGGGAADGGVDGKAAVARRCLRLLLRDPAARLAGPHTQFYIVSSWHLSRSSLKPHESSHWYTSEMLKCRHFEPFVPETTWGTYHKGTLVKLIEVCMYVRPWRPALLEVSAMEPLTAAARAHAAALLCPDAEDADVAAGVVDAAAAADAATAYGKAAMHLAMCGGGSGGAVVGPLPDIARHVIRCHFNQQSRVQHACR